MKEQNIEAFSSFLYSNPQLCEIILGMQKDVESECERPFAANRKFKDGFMNPRMDDVGYPDIKADDYHNQQPMNDQAFLQQKRGLDPRHPYRTQNIYV